MTIHQSFQIIPPGAPFSDAQRAWLNRFFAEALYRDQPVPGEDESTPWKDPAMPLEERMTLAAGRPLRWKLAAAMAQQDCGQCGSNCADYSRAIFEQGEPRLNLCAPGGKATARMLKALVEEMGGGVIDPEQQAARAAAPRPDAGRPGYSRAAPVTARLVSVQRLNGPNSGKHTSHVEIDLSESGIAYEAGDSLGVCPVNDPALVRAVMESIGVPPDFPIAGERLEAVLARTCLGAAPDALFQFISYLTGGERRQKAKDLARGGDPDGDAATLDVLAALRKFAGIHPDPEALVEVLQPLQPRLYSISSSPRTQPGRVSLTVDMVRYEQGGRERLGVASTWLGARLAPGAPIQVYVQKAHGFALPRDGAVPIIMVGPGTGVAPFRAFLQERHALKAPGPAWLFFGHQRQADDFFYAREWEALSRAGVLTRLSTAWSRDAGPKTYVQDRMREDGAELWAWLQRGAHFYVCGDATRMAKDVDRALREITARHGGMDAAAAERFVAGLKAAGRYQTDVY
jgi:sulfite reductase (NADPH) flavoprotein alpha-component